MFDFNMPTLKKRTRVSMSNQDQKPAHEPAKRAPLSVEKKPRKRRGFFSTIISHLMVAAIAVVGIGSYLHWDDILNYTGTRVCAYDMLGQYAGQKSKTPAIDLNKSPGNNTAVQQKKTEKSVEQNSPAATPPQVESSSNATFASKLEAARKLFWNKEKSALAAYEKLFADNPDNAELQAELGNVYYKNDQKDKAIEMYLSAGKKFTAQKKTAKVTQMRDFLNKLAPEKAKTLSPVE